MKFKKIQSLDSEPQLINLKRFLVKNNFKPAQNLKLWNFPATGRGVGTLTALHDGDVLMLVPYHLLITLTTLQNLNYLELVRPGSKLKLQELLTLFLVLEKHKGNSTFKPYIESLPRDTWIPALLQDEHIELLPPALRAAVQKSRGALLASFKNLKAAVWGQCECCQVELTELLTWHSFTWGFILVNTRAVYVDPSKVISRPQEVLLDEPCMALCPFLDMFNHSSTVRTTAEVVDVDQERFYKLTTRSNFRRFEQVFISYGVQDNVKLLVEYGFFLPHNPHDSVAFESETVVRQLELGLNKKQRDFVAKHNLEQDFYISEDGASFNLKAFLFVATSGDRSYDTVIYTSEYDTQFLRNLKEFVRKLCQKEVCDLEGAVRKLQEVELKAEERIVIAFLEERKKLVLRLQDLV